MISILKWLSGVRNLSFWFTTAFFAVIADIVYFLNRFLQEMMSKLYDIEFSRAETLEFVDLSLFKATITTNYSEYSFVNYGTVTAVGVLIICGIAWLVLLWLGQNSNESGANEPTKIDEE